MYKYWIVESILDNIADGVDKMKCRDDQMCCWSKWTRGDLGSSKTIVCNKLLKDLKTIMIFMKLVPIATFYGINYWKESYKITRKFHHYILYNK